jgi:ribonuclease HI
MGLKATVFMAEIRAITTVAHTLMQRKNQKIVIRCDSQAAIQAINNININSKTVLECRKLLNQLGAKVGALRASHKISNSEVRIC